MLGRLFPHPWLTLCLTADQVARIEAPYVPHAPLGQE